MEFSKYPNTLNIFKNIRIFVSRPTIQSFSIHVPLCHLWRAVSDKNTCRKISNTSSKYIQLILGIIQLMEKNISLIVKNTLLTTKIFNLLGK